MDLYIIQMEGTSKNNTMQSTQTVTETHKTSKDTPETQKASKYTPKTQQISKDAHEVVETRNKR